MNQTEAITLAERVVMGTYKRFPLMLVRGEGARVWDGEGKAYLDCVAGIAVCSLGHSHPAVTAAIARQASRLMHCSNLYYTEPQIQVARFLAERSFADQVFFCNSGAEANEAAIKLARKAAFDRKGPDHHEIITMEGSFHGRTLATVTATAQERFHHGFAPLMPGFHYCPFNDLEALERTVTDRTCAVMLEPIQGEGGIRLPAAGYLEGVRRLCDRLGLLLIFDEVQVGMGRTGTLFAYEQEGVVPDILTLAKALANGFPVGAMLARADTAASFTPGSHASTFGGNPLAMAAALATLEELNSDTLLTHCLRMGERLREGLRSLQQRFPQIREVRGRGLIVGAELEGEGAPVVQACLERGLLINCTNGNILRFVPPLVIGEGEIDEAVAILAAALTAVYTAASPTA